MNRRGKGKGQVGIGFQLVGVLLLVVSLVGPVLSETRFTGTGFIISRDGVVATCNHVIAGQTRLRVRDQDGRIYDAILVARDIANDLAILKIPGNAFPHIQIRKSSDVQKGEEVFVLGFPNITVQGLDTKVTQGIISSTSGLVGEPNSFQISAAAQPGKSGGPLVDRYGSVIGIVNAKLSREMALKVSGALPENVNYAIKSNYLIKLIRTQRGIVYRTAARPSPQVPSVPSVVETVERATVLVIAGRASKLRPRPHQGLRTQAHRPASFLGQETNRVEANSRRTVLDIFYWCVTRG